MRAFRDERGTVLALSAVLIPIFIVLVALAYDVGTWYTHKRQLQNRADAAALAAGVAYSRVFTACNSPDAATKALAESTIEGAARLYAGDPQVAGPLHNTEVTEQTRVNVEVNAPAALASDACSSLSRSSSCSSASRWHSVIDVVTPPSIRTSWSCTSWNPPIARPNCRRRRA